MEMLSQNIQNITASATVAMNQRATELKAAGTNIINLSVGEPDFPTPVHIKQAAIQAIMEDYSYYSPVAGYPELKEAIIQKMKTDNRLDYRPEEVIASNGAKHALANSIMCLINPGDEVIIPAPYWVSYNQLVKFAGGKNIVIPGTFENNYKITPEQLEAAITPRTKALLLCSPSNPTGAIYSKEELNEIAQILHKHPHIFVISDEIYEYINFTGHHHSIAQIAGMQQRTAVINGVSKGFAMTGWRLGYLCGPDWLAEACQKLQGQFTTGPSSISQMAAIQALNTEKTASKNMCLEFEKRKNLILDLLNNIPHLKTIEPAGAFYVFPDVSAYFGKSSPGKTIANDEDLAFYLLEEAHVATVMGSAFGSPNNLRIAFATSEEQIKIAMERIENALAQLT